MAVAEARGRVKGFKEGEESVSWGGGGDAMRIEVKGFGDNDHQQRQGGYKDKLRAQSDVGVQVPFATFRYSVCLFVPADKQKLLPMFRWS